MIAIKIIAGQEFDIFAIEQNDRRDLLNFLVDLKACNEPEFTKLARALDYTAKYGIIKNEQRFKRLSPDIYEFKTFGGIRVLCFFEDRSILILTNGFKKKKSYDDEISRAEHIKLAFLNAKANGLLNYTVESIL